MDALQFFMGITDLGKKGIHGIKTEFDLVELQVVEVLPGFFIVHSIREVGLTTYFKSSNLA